MRSARHSWLLVVLWWMATWGGSVLSAQPTIELEKALSAEGKVNAPLDLVIDFNANHAYVVEQDGDILDIALTQRWQVTNMSILITLEQPSAIALAADTLFIVNGTQLILFHIPSETTQRIELAPHKIAAVSASDDDGEVFVASANGDIFRLSLKNLQRETLGNVGEPVNDMLYDSKRGLIYLSTQRGTLLAFDPAQKTTKRLSFVGPPLGNIDLREDDLFVASVDFGLYKIDLNSPESAPFLFFPRVAGPTALVVQEQRALVTNVGEGIVLLDPLDFSGPLASSAQIILAPALGPVRSLVVQSERQTAFVSDLGNTLWSLGVDPISIASFVFTPFDGRVSLHPEEDRFFATNRSGGQVLAMRFDPPFAFTFEMPSISPVIASGLPVPDGVVYLPASNTVFVGTLDDGALWQVRPGRLQAQRMTFLPKGATSIDLDTRRGNVLILLNQIEATGMGTLMEYNPSTQELIFLHDHLPRAIDLAVYGACIYLVSETGQLFVLSPSLELQPVLHLPQLSAVTIDKDTVYLGTMQGELFYFSIQSNVC